MREWTPREKVRDIRAAYANGERVTSISERLGMDASVIYRIVHRHTYKDVP